MDPFINFLSDLMIVVFGLLVLIALIGIVIAGVIELYDRLMEWLDAEDED